MHELDEVLGAEPGMPLDPLGDMLVQAVHALHLGGELDALVLEVGLVNVDDHFDMDLVWLELDDLHLART